MTTLPSILLPSVPVVLRTLDRLAKEIDRTPTFDGLNRIRRTAKAFQVEFREVKDVSDRAGEIWIAADNRLAEELKKIPRATRTRGQLVGKKAGTGKGKGKGKGSSGGVRREPPEEVPTLADLGITKKRASESKRLNRTLFHGIAVSIFLTASHRRNISLLASNENSRMPLSPARTIRAVRSPCSKETISVGLPMASH